MNDIETVRKRMKKRKDTHQPLNDNNFKNVYNAMIKGMVVLLIGLSIVTYVKLNPNTSIKEYILNDKYFNDATKWLSNTMLGFLPNMEEVPVSTEIMYTHVKDNYYKNNSNEVVNFENGKVIYTGTEKEKGKYIVVLFENDVQVTYAGLQETFVSLYDTVEKGMVVGTYNEKVMLLFECLGKEISYETYLGME